ncbi:MAG TPA: hypothetical protein VFA10_04415 [Ktedonobacteraceae bacterium]|jgi:hypothetical protein|nr:hypothetical protein [Ktedonobacteraceae bacterium]
MELISFKEVLDTFRDNDLLEDEQGKLWMVRHLLSAFGASRSTRSEDAPAGLTLDTLIFIDGENLYPISAAGAIGQTPVFRTITPPEKPYRLICVDHTYRVIFMEDEGQWKYRFVADEPFYRHKQAADRRKDALNEDWVIVNTSTWLK